ncbi:helix-turn-helix transcriptional regulator [Lipingzhangella sp. LS1_29]|uniref:Helix-turn-helix transcriptional regulator n=1 Tax=Lipingzhangella rawalii TaxID=2055835 RepID=A0ABU2H1I2_9ACTN|nr:helix-turn-helix transcriptional regulator [Lipingzhangella rawalii]MDS1268710.1 helix-turn-helix transcriptional regulator [Lipingzhangella rawalii]
MTDFQTARTSLGAQLRQLRVDAGLSGRDLAAQLGWHPAKVSKIERGKQTASPTDLRHWTHGCGSPETADALIAQRRSLETHYASWRRQLAYGTRPRQLAFADQERAARHMRILETACIPGLLQTPAYARAMIRRGMRLHNTPNDLEDAVQARMDRQAILETSGQSVEFLLWEPALQVRLCEPTDHAEQLTDLARRIAHEKLDIGIISIAARIDLVPAHGFWVFDSHLVLVETVSAELSLTDEDAIRPYLAVFRELSQVAARGQAALRIIERHRHAVAR